MLNNNQFIKSQEEPNPLPIPSQPIYALVSGRQITREEKGCLQMQLQPNLPAACSEVYAWQSYEIEPLTTQSDGSYQLHGVWCSNPISRKLRETRGWEMLLLPYHRLLFTLHMSTSLVVAWHFWTSDHPTPTTLAHRHIHAQNHYARPACCINHRCWKRCVPLLIWEIEIKLINCQVLGTLWHVRISRSRTAQL